MAKHPQGIFPTLAYDDPKAAIDWLERAFGFTPFFVYANDQGEVGHAELLYGDAVVMLGGTYDVFNRKSPRDFGGVSQTVYVVVDDPDAHFARAKDAGAEILMAPQDMEYGSRDYVCRDLEGHIWSFGTYRPELGPG